MLEWKTIRLEHKKCIGMCVILPKDKLFMITSKNCILVGNMFDIKHLSKTCNIFIMKKSDSYKALLESEVDVMNEYAKRSGYTNSMIGKEVLLYQNKKNSQ